MKKLIEDFTTHLEKAVKIGNNTTFHSPKNSISQVLICGLGGSGIGGTIITQLVADKCAVPVVVNKTYHIPAFVNENTLVICCSYSGNTEETLSMYELAKSKGAEIAIITSGGKFEELAKENGHNLLLIPGELPPRAAFGLSFPQLFFVFEKHGLIGNEFVSEIESSISFINQAEQEIQKEAHEIAAILFEKIPIIYCESAKEGVAVRFRQQLNENSKMLCWHNVFPELNHNELVGWRTKNQDLAVVILRSSEDFYRNKKRMEYSKQVIANYTDNILEVFAKGNSPLEEALYLIHKCDWASYLLTELKGIDSVEVDVITGLKDMLANLK